MKRCPRTLPRTLLRITLCLLLGVITTVAVAWAMARFAPQTYPDDPYAFARSSGAGQAAHARATERWHDLMTSDDRAYDLYIIHTIEGIGWSFSELTVGEPDDLIIDTRQEVFAGLPMFCLHGHGRLHPFAGTTESTFLFAAGGELEFHGMTLNQRFLPTRPIFPGFIINTLFYAATWLAVSFGFATFKRWNRKRRGLCRICAQDLRGNPEGVTGCAECGWGRIK